MFFQKRGEGREALWWLIDLFISLAIIYFIFAYIDKVGEQTSFQKKFLAHDIALLMDTLYASPGSINIEYPQNTLWFGVSIQKNSVEIYEDRKDPPHLRYSVDFLGNPEYDFSAGTIEPRERPERGFMEKYLPVIYIIRGAGADKLSRMQLYFLKTQNKIKVSNELDREGINNVQCSRLTKFEYSILREENNKELFSNQLFKEIGKIVDTTDIANDPSIKVLVRIMDTDENYVKAFYDSDIPDLANSGCKIGNLINDKIGGDIAIIPQNDFSLVKRTGIDTSPILYIEVGARNRLDDIRNSIYFALK